MSFFQFYQDGGIFMHAITVCALLAGGSMLRALRGSTSDIRQSFQRGMMTGAVGLGVLGTLMGLLELGAALQTVPPPLWNQAIVRGGSIALYPLVFAMLVAVPLQLAGTVVATRRPAAGPS